MSLRTCRIKLSGWNYELEVLLFFNAMYHYSTNVNNVILDAVKISYDNFRNFMLENQEKATPEKIDQFIKFGNDYYAKDLLTDLHHDSLIITLYSFTEKKMKFLADHLAEQRTLKVEDISGKGIFQSRKYLEKICKIEFSEISNEWEILKKFNLLRNFLIHTNGNRSLDNKRNDLLSFLKESPGIHLISKDGQTIFHFQSNETVNLFLKTVKVILNHIYFEINIPTNEAPNIF